MKKNIIKITKITALLLILFFGHTTNAQTVRSYMQQETVGQSANGPIYNVPQNMSTWVKWSEDDRTIQMSDGTIWRYQGQDYGGIHHYKYAGTSSVPMPGTNYVEAMFSPNYDYMQINYTFGMMGMYTPMASKWRYIGEGEQAAYDWTDGNY